MADDHILDAPCLRNLRAWKFVCVYLDELDEAWALLRSSWRMIQTNAQKLDPSLRADLYLLRAKVALQMARRVDHQSHWLAIARASMQEAAEVDVPWVEATLLTLQALRSG